MRVYRVLSECLRIALSKFNTNTYIISKNITLTEDEVLLKRWKNTPKKEHKQYLEVTFSHVKGGLNINSHTGEIDFGNDFKSILKIIAITDIGTEIRLVPSDNSLNKVFYESKECLFHANVKKIFGFKVSSSAPVECSFKWVCQRLR